MAPPIEQTLRPETLNEVLLVERINELHRLQWEAGRYSLTSLTDPNDHVMEVRDFTPTLRLAGAFEADVKIPEGLRIRATTHGPTKFGIANYVSPDQLDRMSPHAEAVMFDDLWRDGMHSLAKEVRRIWHKDPVLAR